MSAFANTEGVENVSATLRSRNTDSDYISLNAELETWGTDSEGNQTVQYESDRTAARQFFLNHVNPNLVNFLELEEKLRFLVDNDYYEAEFLAKYNFEFIKSLYQHVYGKKFRFPTFVGAYKFHSSYSLMTFDGKRYLERFEDRVVAVALFVANGNEQYAWNLAEEMISGRFQPATPTFLNAGKKQRGELVSCFLLNVGDNLNEIMRAVNAAAQLSKRGGGVALNLTSIRGLGDPIKKIENQASGVVPVMKILEDTFSYANQLGARQGAGAVYLNAHHIDIEEFLDTKRENADEKIRIKSLSLGVVIPDITFELARNGEKMYLFSPYDLEQEFGKEMAWLNISEIYREAVENPRIRKKAIDPRDFLTTLTEIQMESGYPYIIFEDAANRANNVGGKIVMSNLCQTGEVRINTSLGYKKLIDLYTSQEEFEVVVDNRARDFNINSEAVSLETSTKVFKTAENADIFKLETKEGYSTRGTIWHKYYVERDGEVVKIPLNDVQVGDRLLIQPAEGSGGKFHDPELAYLAGVIAADGSLTTRSENHSSAFIPLFGEKQVFAPQIEKALENVLARYKDLYALKSNASKTPVFKELMDEDAFKLYSAPLAHILESFGMTNETKLRIPEFVFDGDMETRKAYLAGYLQFDAGIGGARNSPSWSLSVTSVSSELLKEVQILLLDANILSHIYALPHTPTVEVKNSETGEFATWNSSPAWRLNVSTRESLKKLSQFVDFKPSHKAKIANAESLATNRKLPARQFFATVSSIVWDGLEDVYDVTVENGNSLIFNGISTGNCVEILQPQEPSILNDDQTYAKVGKDISCNLGSLNFQRMLESPDFGKSIETAIRTLSTVSDLSYIDAVPTVAEGNRRSHAVGLGLMGLAGSYAKNHIYFGDEESLDLANVFLYTTLFHAIRASNRIAQEKGETFDGFEKSKYATGEFFEKFINPTHTFTPQTEKVKNIFAESSIAIPTTKDWTELAAAVKEHGIYNSHLMAIPPTGSISYVNHATPSTLPVTSTIVEKRTEGKMGTVFVPNAYAEGNEKYYSGHNMYEIDTKKVIDVNSVIQFYVDQAISLTLGYKSTVTTKEVTKNILYAFSKGKPSKTNDERDAVLSKYPSAEIKSLYYVRVNNIGLEGTQNEDCVSCML